MEVGNITKAATFKSFLHLSYKNTVTFFMAVLFNIFMRQALTDTFWVLHRNINCAFPLNETPYKVSYVNQDISKEIMFKKWSYVRLQRNIKELCQMKYEQ